MIAPQNRSGRLSLVLGIDGSGKTTLLNNLHTLPKTAIMEVTSTPEVARFKKFYASKQLNETYINEREKVFLKLNAANDAYASVHLTKGEDVATTSSSLVTRVSHGLMRDMIDEQTSQDIPRTVDEWLESDSLLPDQVIFVHASDNEIRRRLARRHHEEPVKFNHPDFLSRYQETLHEVVECVGTSAVASCLILDSVQLSPTDMVDAYLDFNLGRIEVDS